MHSSSTSQNNGRQSAASSLGDGVGIAEQMAAGSFGTSSRSNTLDTVLMREEQLRLRNSDIDGSASRYGSASAKLVNFAGAEDPFSMQPRLSGDSSHGGGESGGGSGSTRDRDRDRENSGERDRDRDRDSSRDADMMPFDFDEELPFAWSDMDHTSGTGGSGAVDSIGAQLSLGMNKMHMSQQKNNQKVRTYVFISLKKLFVKCAFLFMLSSGIIACISTYVFLLYFL
jgi:hypothetical protein